MKLIYSVALISILYQKGIGQDFFYERFINHDLIPQIGKIIYQTKDSNLLILGSQRNSLLCPNSTHDFYYADDLLGIKLNRNGKVLTYKFINKEINIAPVLLSETIEKDIILLGVVSTSRRCGGRAGNSLIFMKLDTLLNCKFYKYLYVTLYDLHMLQIEIKKTSIELKMVDNNIGKEMLFDFNGDTISTYTFNYLKSDYSFWRNDHMLFINKTNDSICVNKTDSIGNLLWTKKIGCPYCQLENVLENNATEIVFYGASGQIFDLKKIFFFAIENQTGNFLWYKNISEDVSYYTLRELTRFENYFYTVAESYSKEDFFFKLDTNYNFIAGKSLGSYNPFLNGPVIQDKDHVYMVGTMGNDIVFIKTNFEGAMDGEIKFDPLSTSTKTMSTKNIQIFPNPVNNMLNIQGSITINKVEIFDLLGRSIAQFVFLNDTAFTKEVDFLKSGLYILKITMQKNEILITKFLKE